MYRLVLLTGMALLLSQSCAPPKKPLGIKGPATFLLNNFRTLEEIKNTFSSYENSPPSFGNDSMKISFSYLDPATFCGNKIPVISLSSAFTAYYTELQEDGSEKDTFVEKDELLFVSGLHMDEATPPEVMMDFLDLLVDEFYNNEVFRVDLQYVIIHIIPIVNVDTKIFMDNLANEILNGTVPLTKTQLALSSLSLQQFRKNMRFMNRCETPDELLANHGVDLNRNFAADWPKLSSIDNAIQVGTGTELKYKGTSAASEPEVIAIQKFIKRRKRLQLVLDLHDKIGPEVALNQTATKQATFFGLATKKKFYASAATPNQSPTISNSTTSPVYGTLEHYADSLKIPYVVGIEIGNQSLPDDTDYVKRNSERLGLSFLSMTKFMAKQHKQRK